MTAKNTSFFDRVAPVLLVVVVGLAFAVGVLWQKVSALDSGSSTGVAAGTSGVGGGNPQAAAPQAPPEVGEVEPVRVSAIEEGSVGTSDGNSTTEVDHVRGNPDARLDLIEYSDLECPFCKSFHPTAQQAVEEYPGDVMWVYRHFPLDQLHPKADKQAEAVECAGKLAGNDGFWALTGKIFEVTPSNNGLDNSTLPDLAASVGINKAAFTACLDSGEFADHVEADYQSGIKAGVTGTPGNILLDRQTGETRLIPGAVPYPQLKQAIDEMLASS